MTTFQAIVLAIIEGVTEFLPISSTGHMIIGTALLGMEPNDFVKMFTVCIQFGAILSVIVLYWKRFFQTTDFYFKLFAAFLPAAVFGFLLDKYIDEMLGSVTVVAISLFLGGILLLFIDNLFKENENVEEKEISYPTALKIGLFQAISMIPGISRSGATIIGGMTQKLSRKQAAEFSFFLAVPTMFAASAYKMLKVYDQINTSTLPVLIIGNIVAFVVAMLAIKSFITFLTKHGFKVFGWYRIIVGGILLILIAMNIELKVL